MSNIKKNHSFNYFIAFLFLLPLFFPSQISGSERTFYAIGEKYAVSSGHTLATKTAAEILRKGGNAIDAAVSAAFVLGVVDFSNSGIGGDGFALVSQHIYGKNRIFAYDGSITRPSAPNTSYAGLPALPALLLQMLKNHGTMPYSEILKPAINYAEEGFKVTPYLETVALKTIPKIKDKKALSLLTGSNLKAGEIFKQPILATTLKEMASDSNKSFYSGQTAKAILEDLKIKGSGYRFTDFVRYNPKLTLPLRVEYENFDIFGTLPPSSSLIAIKLGTALDASGLDLSDDSPYNSFLLAKFSRPFLEERYSSLAFYAHNPYELFQLIPDNCNPANSEKILAEASNTTHICVWDSFGNAVSMTLTLGSHFGTQELSPCGFFYNNELKNYTKAVADYPDDYSKKLGPISSKSPIIVLKNRQLFAALGGAGSDRIIQNTGLLLGQLLSNQTDKNMLSRLRFFMDHKQILHLESNPEGIEPLIDYPKINHRNYGEDYFGLECLILKDSNIRQLKAFGDFRRDGSSFAE
ncbi:MAG: hypothetical protein GX221_09155 [Candidatus Riflebacteria bacterium]|nr:hypothetical protein [Candidatus Riflebacteria bacterium]